jgi:hypothetical protein
MVAPVLAQDAPEERTPSGDWVIGSSFGAGQSSGGYGEFLEEPINFDLNLSKGRGAWRFGLGIQFGSMEMKPPYEDELEWARFDTYLFATRLFNHSGKVRPYLQARIGLARIHPRSELFWFDEPENLEPGASPTKAANGFSFTFQPGVQIELTPGLALDVSAWWTGYQTSEYSTIPPLVGPVDPPVSENEFVSSGQEYGLRVGLKWRPLSQGVRVEPEPRVDPQTGLLASLPPADGDRDAWGVSRSWGWATGEMLAINFGASMINEYVRQANFNQISPRSFYENIKEGWTFDDNEFKTNQLMHPFNGSAYFNAARTNGLGFWQSSLMSNVGAFIWECCGETHPMAWNDMMSTGLGGMARGEWAYRISSLILDNSKTGWRRYMREFGALPFNPIRTGNRFVSGRATTRRGNPEDPYDWRPPYLALQLYAGARAIGEGESISENTNYYGFIEGTLQYGSPFKNTRRKPFDRFDTSLQLNLGEKTRVGRLQIRGDLASWKLGDQDDPRNVFAITQDFDYIDNEAYEYGGQFFGGSLFTRFGETSGTRFVTRLTGYVSPMAAVNADYSFLADVPDRERFREYDYGPGVGAGVEGFLYRKGRALLGFSYRYTYINVKNGSIYNPDDDNLLGSDAEHQLHRVGVRLIVPIGGTWGIGADARLFYRDSKYSLPELEDTTQRNPELRVFLTWDLGYTRRNAVRAERAAESAR